MKEVVFFSHQLPSIMNVRLSFFLLLLIGWLAGCSSVTVQQNANVDYTQYRTFAWAETEVKTDGSQNSAVRRQLDDNLIRQAVETELAKRGITPGASGNPDFYLTYHLYVDEVERTVTNPGTAYPVAYPYLVRYGSVLVPVNYGHWYRATPTTYRTETYQEGTLVLDFIDAKSSNLVWRGSILDAEATLARVGQEFAEAARDILDKFPVKEQK